MNFRAFTSNLRATAPLRVIVCSILLTMVFAFILGSHYIPLRAQSPSHQIFMPMLAGSVSVESNGEEEIETVEPGLPEEEVENEVVATEEVIWSESFESGRVDRWLSGGQISISGAASAKSNDKTVRTGRYAAELQIVGANGLSNPSPGVRLAWHAKGYVAASDPKNLPGEAYYSAHYYFPNLVAAEWWNLMQWKQAAMTSATTQTRVPIYFVSAVYGSDNAMHYVLRSKVDAEGNYVQPGDSLAYSTTAIPVKSWTRLECLYRWSKEPTGRIACWQDGQLLWDVNNIITEFDTPYLNYPRQWAVNNYAAHTYPQSPIIYVDDLAIRTQPLP